MAKYRVTDKMPHNVEGYKAGDILEYPIEIATRLILKGYIEPLYAILEPLPMDEAKQDKQLRSYKRKGV
jgi:hypothetical protein